jgi:hypothetical protein
LILLPQFQILAQLEVSVSQPKITGSKSVIKLEMKNTFTEPIQSAQATVFLSDGNNQHFGQATKWVIGNGKKLPVLAGGAETTFNFVIPLTKTMDVTNLQAQVTFNRLVIGDGKVVNVNKNVQIK